MRRIERLLGEARHLRVRRATRVRVGREDSSAFWLDEMRVAQRIVGDLMEADDPAPDGAVPEAGGEASGVGSSGVGSQGIEAPASGGPADIRRRTGPVDVLEPAVLVPLIDAFQAALEAACPPDVRTRLFRTLHLKVTERLNPAGVDALRTEFADGGGVDEGGNGGAAPRRPADRARRAAVVDASHLVLEVAAFEAMRRWCEESDGSRPVSSYVDASTIELRGDRIGKRRPEKPVRRTKGQLNAERSFSRFWRTAPGSLPDGEASGRGDPS